MIILERINVLRKRSATIKPIMLPAVPTRIATSETRFNTPFDAKVYNRIGRKYVVRRTTTMSLNLFLKRGVRVVLMV